MRSCGSSATTAGALLLPPFASDSASQIGAHNMRCAHDDVHHTATCVQRGHGDDAFAESGGSPASGRPGPPPQRSSSAQALLDSHKTLLCSHKSFLFVCSDVLFFSFLFCLGPRAAALTCRAPSPAPMASFFTASMRSDLCCSAQRSPQKKGPLLLVFLPASPTAPSPLRRPCWLLARPL